MDASLETASFKQDRVWGLSVPGDGPAEARPYLDPYETWTDKAAFLNAAADLRARISPTLSEYGAADTLIQPDVPCV